GYCVDDVVHARISWCQSWEDSGNIEAAEPSSTGPVGGAIRRCIGERRGCGADRSAAGSRWRTGLLRRKTPVLPPLESEPPITCGVEVPVLCAGVVVLCQPIYPKSLSWQLF